MCEWVKASKKPLISTLMCLKLICLSVMFALLYNLHISVPPADRIMSINPANRAQVAFFAVTLQLHPNLSFASLITETAAECEHKARACSHLHTRL